MKYLLALVALALSGCQALTDIAAALPTPTPQEQCEDGGGAWQPITTYDASGNELDGGQCLGHPEWNRAPIVHGTRVQNSPPRPTPAPQAKPAPKKDKAAAPAPDEPT